MTSTAVREDRVEVDGAALQVFRGGSGPPLLVLHDCEVMPEWHPYHEALGRSFSVAAPSHPGFGASERPDGMESVEDLAYLYLDFLDTLGPEPVTLLGLGLGGWIAAEMAVRCSHRLRRLVLAGPVGIKVSGPTEPDILETFVLTRQQILEAGWHNPGLGEERMKLPGTPDLPAEELLTLLRNRESAVRYTWKPFMHNPNLRRWLRRITVPTLLIWGGSDGIVSTDYGRAFQQSMPGAGLQVIPEAGHYPYLERPDAFVEAVAGFAG